MGSRRPLCRRYPHLSQTYAGGVVIWGCSPCLYLLNKELSSSPRNPLPDLLYSSIVSAIGNVVDFMVGTSELVDIALGYAALLKSKNCKPSSMR